MTIQDVIVEQSTIYDDDPSIVLHTDNGAKFRIEGGYGEDTGESAHEFRSTLTLTSLKTASGNLTTKKVRGIRIQYGNNQKKEYVTIEDMIMQEFDKMDYNSKLSLVEALKYKV